MLAAYGFGLFPLPPLRDAHVGSWRVVAHRAGLVDGYVSGRAAALEAGRHVLYHGRTAWMSSSLLELESHAYHVRQARGLVVAAGLGLGLYAYAAAAKSEVGRVVVVERAPEVIALMRRATGFDRWPDRAKVALVEGDALDDAGRLAALVAEAGGAERRPDYLYADIWPGLAAPAAPAQTAAMARALRPAAAGWWGQELAFGLWWRAQGRREEPDTAALRAYAGAVGVPIPITVRYPAFCRDAIAAAGLLRPRRTRGLAERMARGWRWLRLRQGRHRNG
jgi:hypothetical protein